MSKTKSNWQDDLRQDITNKIIDGLKKGIVPWRKPWSNDPNCGYAVNVVTKKAYRGVNPLVLELTAMSAGYTSRYWGSYKQFASIGGQVRKGEHGTTVVFSTPLEVDDPKNKDKKKKIWLLRYYTVFNLAQVDGEKLDHLRPAKPDPNVVIQVLPNWEPADVAIKATGAKISYGGNRAFYSRESDSVQIPNREQFHSIEEWYSTHFHEIGGHWTEIRRNWKGSYAMGEIIAEMTSCFIAHALNVPDHNDIENHNAYLATWLKEMESDSKWIFKASQEAGKATDLFLSFSQKNSHQEDEN